VIGYAEINIIVCGKGHAILSVCHFVEWCIDIGANIYMCAEISMYAPHQVARTFSLLMGNMYHGFVHGVGTVNLKFTPGISYSHYK
jgi:hypothetical protein